jgi:hypothetical protein
MNARTLPWMSRFGALIMAIALGSGLLGSAVHSTAEKQPRRILVADGPDPVPRPIPLPPVQA